MITRLPVRPCSDKVGDECDGEFRESKGSTEDGRSLLNQANAEPFRVIAKALHRTGS